MEKMLATVLLAATFAVCYSLPYDYNYYKVEKQPRATFLDYLRDMSGAPYEYTDNEWYPSQYDDVRVPDLNNYFYPSKQDTEDDYYGDDSESFDDFVFNLENWLNMKNGQKYSTVEEDAEEKEENETEEDSEPMEVIDKTQDVPEAKLENSQASTDADELSKELESIEQTSAEQNVADDTITQQTPQEIRDEMDRKRGQPETVSVDGKMGVDVSEVQYDKKAEDQLESLKENPFDALGDKSVNAKKATHPFPVEAH